MIMINQVKDYLLDLQQRLCKSIENEDGKATFFEDLWQYGEGGGGGDTRVIADGDVIEKGGVNFSHIHGKSLPAAATAKRPEFNNAPFQALGISSVIHPLNPYCPTAHMNVRCIVVDQKDKDPIWWFGGGFDLTPYYGFEEDCKHFHQMAKEACEPFGKEVYPEFKRNADDYFYLKHRHEPRGIGGIFYDDLNAWGFERCFEFMRSVGDHFIKAYVPLLAKRKNQTYGKRERDFQLYRRGRYVEFNLLYDRGTLFGIQSNGRTESILMSLPPLVVWEYQYHPELGTVEDKFYQDYLRAKEWI